MEEWRQCGRWLIDCKVLPPNHRVVWPSAAVFDLAQALRDGVLLCQMLHNLSPGSVDLKEINFRPQMSQFLCLKNIRTFLKVCHDKFGLRNSELFDPFDLFDVRDFGKVISSLSKLSHHNIAQIKGIRPFPSEDTLVNEDDVYRSLEELADEHDVAEEDIYDCVLYEEDDIYEDIIKVEVRQPMQKMGMTEDDKRNCCLLEIQETEAKYYKTLEDIEKNYMIPLNQVLSPQDMEAIFLNLEEVIKVHLALLKAIDVNMMSGGNGLGKIFLDFKERLLIYGQYCSHMEGAQKTLDDLITSRDDIRMKVEECTMRVQEGKFKLQDLLVVPMQRILKYHLLLKELLSHSADRPERQQLREALEAMQDLAMYINEVKRDNETLKKISEFQNSIENLQVKLEEYGRPKMDGELKVSSVINRTKQDRYIFLFDKVVIVCKRRGYNYELKEVIELQSYKMTDDPMSNRDIKKSSGKMWSYCFYLVQLQGKHGFQFFCKTEEMKRKWMEQFEMAMSNIKPDRATANQHNFQMHTGIFYQGYYCPKCGTGAHKECLEVVSICKISPHDSEPGLTASGPKMAAVRNYHGSPAPPGTPALTFHTGDIIELLKGDPDTLWWEGKLFQSQKTGFFPSSCVKPCLDPKPPLSRPSSREMDYHAHLWFAGNMERQQADNLLKSHSSGTYLIRERTAEAERFAISIKFNDEVKHIKVVEKDNWIHITEAKKFESLMELVEYYQTHSLKESFKLLDTMLLFPYKSQERSNSRSCTHSPASCASYSFSFLSPQDFSSQSSTPFWSVFGPRPIGTAVARYNFAARDLRELSLREGDVVKIYSKIGGDQGWWKGEANGRVGWFPSTYVDEEGLQRGSCERPFCQYKHAKDERVFVTLHRSPFTRAAGTGRNHLPSKITHQNIDGSFEKDPCILELERINKEIETVKCEVEMEQRRLSHYKSLQGDCDGGNKVLIPYNESVSKGRNSSNHSTARSQKSTVVRSCISKYVVDNSRLRTDLEYDPLSNYAADVRSSTSAEHKPQLCDAIEEKQGLKRTREKGNKDQHEPLTLELEDSDDEVTNEVELLPVSNGPKMHKISEPVAKIDLSSGEEIDYSDMDLSDSDPMEECYRIFMEANQAGQESVDHPGSSPVEVSDLERPGVKQKPLLLSGPKKRVAHVSKHNGTNKSRHHVIIPMRGSATHLSNPSRIQQLQQKATVLTTAIKGGQAFVAATTGQKKLVNLAPAPQHTAVQTTCVNIIPVGATIQLGSSVHFIIPEGNIALPLTPVPTPVVPPQQTTLTVAKPILIKRKLKARPESSTKVPHDIRQRYVNLFVEEFLKTSFTVQDAFEKALAEEKMVYDRSINKLKYLSVAVNALKKLKNQNAPSFKASTEANVQGSRGKIVLTPVALQANDPGVALLYEQLKEHILSEAGLKEYGYPLQHPEKPGCAVLYVEVKKGGTDPVKRICCRCGATFSVSQSGRHVRKEECNYHYGKGVENKVPGGMETRYSCCEGAIGTPGCQVFKLHVHDTVSLDGFVSSLLKPPLPEDGCPGVFALGCEMCYTTQGLELARVTVVNTSLQIIYDTFVKPDNEVIDYNTRFSGVSEEDLKASSSSIHNVQEVLQSFVSADTILIGYSLEKDLCALKLLHSTVVDISAVFPHRLGLPHKRGLRSLTADYLRRIIQESVKGHDSGEDATACMELMLWKVKEDAKVKRW
ncbi:hypothetical protein AAFF_G00272480 [Aldrovandia affinis]|uniref:Guanine nucleotide exchange factor VAV2 n=4 Tax=Teleostei TaxID=32443 RepID=A0AAD7RAZ0_9TELE|nr:hypothetical protein AAFF_G00272480 [Aldrovandia affinis]